MAETEQGAIEIDVTGCPRHERGSGDCLACLTKWNIDPKLPNRASLLHPNVLARRFRPGTSGNPVGGSPKKTLEEIVTVLLGEAVVDPKTGQAMVRKELIGRALLAQAAAGKHSAMKLLLERVWPKREIHEINANGRLVVVFDDQDRREIEAAEGGQDGVAPGRGDSEEADEDG